jgi:CheY-like chemotaxis protein
VLIIDDHPDVSRAYIRVLTDSGFHARAAHSAETARAAVAARAIDLWLVDWWLNDEGVCGTDLVREFRAAGHQTPFILISAFLTDQLQGEAANLGAVAVLDKPHTSLAALVSWINRTLRPAEAHATAHGSRDGTITSSRPAHERLALRILRGARHHDDLRTIDEWARHEGMSDRRLRDLCERCGVHPRNVRDFMRALGAVLRAAREGGAPQDLLDIRDAETLRVFCRQAGFPLRPAGPIAVEAFLAQQQFLAVAHPVLHLVRAGLREHT